MFTYYKKWMQKQKVTPQNIIINISICVSESFVSDEIWEDFLALGLNCRLRECIEYATLCFGVRDELLLTICSVAMSLGVLNYRLPLVCQVSRDQNGSQWTGHNKASKNVLWWELSFKLSVGICIIFIYNTIWKFRDILNYPALSTINMDICQ